MEFKKNDILTIDIEDMGHDGEGIGKADGYTLFVKDTVIGDRAEVKIMKTKKNYGYARLLKVLRPSPDRTEPRCPIARACGGCQLQFLSYEKQLEFKKKKVLGNLQKPSFPWEETRKEKSLPDSTQEGPTVLCQTGTVCWE